MVSVRGGEEPQPTGLHHAQFEQRLFAHHRAVPLGVEREGHIDPLDALDLQHIVVDLLHELIGQASVCRGWDKDLSYWDIKAKISMRMLEEAKEVFLTNKEKFSDLQLEELSVLV